MSLIIKAARLARDAHSGQFRKWTYIPGRPFCREHYIMHPARVAARVTLLPDATEEMVAAAWMHDVLEDTEFPLEFIHEHVDAQVARYVEWLTDQTVELKDDPAYPRAERKRLERERLQQAPIAVRLIKLCDRLDNLMSADRMPEKFRVKYVDESVLLVKEIGGINRALEEDILDLTAGFLGLKEDENTA